MSQKALQKIVAKIEQRSQKTRQQYLQLCDKTKQQHPPRVSLSCGNFAHGFAACNSSDKQVIKMMGAINIGIVNAYNDMLSAHHPLKDYPDFIKQDARSIGSTAQVAGCVPAMCDGVTQGKPGMEMSLFSRDVIAMATAISLSHNMFDANIMLGVCDKIVPGLLIGSLQFGHLPTAFIGAGPMPSGLPNKEKIRVRQLFAAGKVGKDELLNAESKSYHSPGTCTFYGTANSNQVIVELLGLQLPGSSFVNPNDPLRRVLITETVIRLNQLTQQGVTMAQMVNAKSIVNAIVGLMATGGSTNLAIHIIAIAKSAGIVITLEDLAAISAITPLIARVYPNGSADVNQFHAAGGVGFIVQTLSNAGLLNADVHNLMGAGIESFCQQPTLIDGNLKWQKIADKSKDDTILRPVTAPFSADGGLKVLKGNLGKAIIKTSAVAEQYQKISAQCIVLNDQTQLKPLFESGQLNRDVIVVVRFQCPNSNGMPELHMLTPYLGLLQEKGFRVALVTDGRMSGASGKVAAAIHVTPSAINGGLIGYLQDGDTIHLNATTFELSVDNEEVIRQRPIAQKPDRTQSLGRTLFSQMRSHCNSALSGATNYFEEDTQ